MPKRLDDELISRIEKCYLDNESESYSSLADRFQVGLSTLERLGRERNWARKRDQQKARRATKLIKQSAIITQSSDELSFSQFSDEFGQRKLLSIVRKALLAFEFSIDQNAESPRVLASLAGGLAKLVDVHVKLQPLTATDLVEVLIESNVGPEDFLNQLRSEKERRNLALKN